MIKILSRQPQNYRINMWLFPHVLIFHMNSELCSSFFMHVYLHFADNYSNIVLAESENGNQGMVTIHGGGEKTNAPRYLVGSVTENNVEKGVLALGQLPCHVYLSSGISFAYRRLNSHGLFLRVIET